MNADLKQLSVLIVDDEPLAAGRLRRLCERIDGIAVVGVANTSADAVNRIGASPPDVVLLDITMPGSDGLAVARFAERTPRPPSIIFTTAHDRYAVEAFSLGAIDYLMKPVSEKRLHRALERVRQRVDPGPLAATGFLKEFWAPRGSDVVHLAVDEIELVNAEGDYMRIHAGARSYLIHTTITGLEAALDPSKFLRVHRSTIVARRAIAAVRRVRRNGMIIELKDGRSIAVGETYLARVRAVARTEVH